MKGTAMRYDIDLTKVSLEGYLALLKRQTLLPSRRMLLEDTDSRFKRIQAQGIQTVGALLKALSTPAKLEAFAAGSGVPAPYLTLLRREAGTLRQRPVPLSVFPDTNPTELEALQERGMHTSKDYFESEGPGGRLYVLCDLVRVNGVGPGAAAMFYAAGIRSAAELARADAKTLLARVAAVNADHRYYQGKLGEKDMQFCIDFARVLQAFP